MLYAMVYSLLFYFHIYLMSIAAVVGVSMIVSLIFANKMGD